MRINASRLGASLDGAWLPLCFIECQRAASVEELVFLHDVQAYPEARCQNSRCQFGAPSHGSVSLSVTGRLAAQPPLRESQLGERFDAPIGRLRIVGVRWKNSQRGFEEREPSASVCFIASCCSRSLSMAMLTYPSKPAPLPLRRLVD